MLASNLWQRIESRTRSTSGTGVGMSVPSWAIHVDSVLMKEVMIKIVGPGYGYAA